MPAERRVKDNAPYFCALGNLGVKGVAWAHLPDFLPFPAFSIFGSFPSYGLTSPHLMR
jgi:hypothetical protein